MKQKENLCTQFFKACINLPRADGCIILYSSPIYPLLKGAKIGHAILGPPFLSKLNTFDK